MDTPTDARQIAGRLLALLGAAIAFLTGRTPRALVASDLRRFKAVLEGGEAPTTNGQPAGARSAIGRVANAWAATR